jgi:hypothetical protein
LRKLQQIAELILHRSIIEIDHSRSTAITICHQYQNIMQKIISVVARLPPSVDGVGDYALLLADNLATQHDIATQFIACDPLQPAVPGVSDLQPLQLLQRSSANLLILLDRCSEIDILLLHYVGYGFAKRGCPGWLADALIAWRQAKATRKLVVMFHEVYASSNQPWSSQFWTSSIQQKIARDLHDRADLVLTNTQIYDRKLTKLSTKHSGNIQVLPIFSTIGECDPPIQTLDCRHPWLVTFGNTNFRKSIYTASIDQLTTICQQLEISEIYDIGNKSTEIVRSIPHVQVHAMGILPAPEISQIFRMARVGFLNYPVAYLAKSTIFAAYASHKLCPIFDRQNIEPNQDGIEVGRHYWALQQPEDRIDLVTAQTIADNAYQWYSEHNLTQTTNRVAKLLQNLRYSESADII